MQSIIYSLSVTDRVMTFFHQTIPLIYIPCTYSSIDNYHPSWRQDIFEDWSFVPRLLYSHKMAKDSCLLNSELSRFSPFFDKNEAHSIELIVEKNKVSGISNTRHNQLAGIFTKQLIPK